MTDTLSPNTQAILLLTAPLIDGRGKESEDLLKPSEYKRLAVHLREIQRQPADLLSAPDADGLMRECQSVIEASRIERLLGRGFLLSQVVERWQTRAIWVVSRADAGYPSRIKARLREDAPAIIYGCGARDLLKSGGLAVVGSRHVDEDLLDYTSAVGRLAARSAMTVVSGGAKGVDQAAMRGALEVGGSVIGVLSDSLEKTVMNRENRNLLLDGRLVLISPYDPSAGFNVGHAMQRNKLIYALSDAALIVNADLDKGGTWEGAKEQLDKLKFVPLYVRSTGDSSPGLDELRSKGALAWPNPQNATELQEIVQVLAPGSNTTLQIAQPLFTQDGSLGAATTMQLFPETSAVSEAPSGPDRPIDTKTEQESVDETPTEISEANGPISTELSTPADTLFAAASSLIQNFLKSPMKDSEIASELGVSTSQAKDWLYRMVDEGVIEKQKKPIRYIAKQSRK